MPIQPGPNLLAFDKANGSWSALLRAKVCLLFGAADSKHYDITETEGEHIASMRVWEVGDPNG